VWCGVDRLWCVWCGQIVVCVVWRDYGYRNFHKIATCQNEMQWTALRWVFGVFWDYEVGPVGGQFR
jgi:hypothetical protein